MMKTVFVTALTAISLAFATPAFSETVLENEEYKITIFNEESWSGVNGTGNLFYEGCNKNNGDCLSLTGGKTTCREGICRSWWTNGNYYYIIEGVISQDGCEEVYLIVREGSNVILKTPVYLPYCH